MGIGFLALLCSFLVVFNQQLEMKLAMADMNARMDTYMSSNDRLVSEIGKAVQSQREDVTSQFQQIGQQMDEMSRILTHLSNRTTNADVLEQLKVTYGHMQGDVNRVKGEVDMALEQTQLDINAQLKSNNKAFEDAQNRATDALHNTEDHVSEIIHDANEHILFVQSNVTVQMGHMQDFVDATVERLNADVGAAEAKIAEDVHLLQENVDKYVDVTNKQFAQEDDFVRFQLAGTFTLLGSLISMYHLTGHLRHYNKPEVQRRIMAVLWMVPIYGVTSWLSLVATSYEPMWSFFRDSYEAYAIYTFVALLVAIVEDGNGLSGLIGMLTKHVEEEQEALEEAKENNVWPRPKLHLKPPFPCCYDDRPASVAKAWLFQCRLMALQFVLSKPVLGLLPLLFHLLNIEYESHSPLLPDGRHLDWTAPRLYVLIASNTSVAIAFWGLLNFYHGMAQELAWCNPWPKFLCIKGVVFMTFWQGFAIQAMATLGYVGDRQASQIQNLLTCIEMLLASLAHFYIFPHYEWQEGYKKEVEKQVLIRDTLALRDFVTDMKMMTTRWEGDDSVEVDVDGCALSTSIPRSRKGSVESASADHEYLRDAAGETPTASAPTREKGKDNEDGEDGPGCASEGEGVWQLTPSHGSLSAAGSPHLHPESYWRDNSGIYRSPPALDRALEELDRNIEELEKNSPSHAEEELWADRDSDPR